MEKGEMIVDSLMVFAVIIFIICFCVGILNQQNLDSQNETTFERNTKACKSMCYTAIGTNMSCLDNCITEAIVIEKEKCVN